MFDDLPRDPSLADPLPVSPLPLLTRWLDEAVAGRGTRNPLAISLATVGLDGRPRLRVVLCRGFESDPGHLVFYTNRESDKGRELEAHPFAAASFFWDGMQRQVRIEGPVTLSPDAESDAYFASRPRPSQIAAWASRQSQPIASREALLARLEQETDRLGGPDGAPVPRPPHWGGYRVHFERIEFWVGAEGRAHDRARYTRRLGPDGTILDGAWQVERLQP